MNFDLSDDQRMLGDSFNRLLADRYGFDRRRLFEQEGCDPELWAAFAKLGVLGLPFAESDGGFGGDAVDVMLIMEACGRALVLEPYLGAVVLAGTALRRIGTAAQRAKWIPEIAAGTFVPAWAHHEAAARHVLSLVQTTAVDHAGQWRLDGSKTAVLHGSAADMLIVSARMAGAEDSEGGLGLFSVSLDEPGLVVRPYRLQDGRMAADLTLDDVAGELMDGDGWAAIQAVTEAGVAAACADALGAMETAHALTVDYLKTRQQFGRTIGSNQALQHRAAEMLVELEMARSMTLLAAMMLDEPDPAERALNIGRAKLIVGRAARFVGQQAVQLHGGIGVTEDYQVGHCLRRLLVFEQMFGDTAHHLSALAETV